MLELSTVTVTTVYGFVKGYATQRLIKTQSYLHNQRQEKPDTCNIVFFRQIFTKQHAHAVELVVHAAGAD